MPTMPLSLIQPDRNKKARNQTIIPNINTKVINSTFKEGESSSETVAIQLPRKELVEVQSHHVLQVGSIGIIVRGKVFAIAAHVGQSISI